jgi:hypothetical protein
MMGFLFTGNNCSQSRTVQKETFICQDYQRIPAVGERAYIYVTDINGHGTVYHNDYTTVGDMYNLTDKGLPFEDDMFIYIYSSAERTEANLLQYVQYHSACSGDVFLNDRFGASQLVEWNNVQQGTVSSKGSVTLTVGVTIPLTAGQRNVTLDSLLVRTNFAGFLNLTNQVARDTLTAGSSIAVNVPNQIDLATSMRYTLLADVVGGTDKGLVCTGENFTSFSAGLPAPPTFPTVAPTHAPSTSMAPTLNRLTAPCNLQALIKCETFGNNKTIPCSGVSYPPPVPGPLRPGNKQISSSIRTVTITYAAVNNGAFSATANSANITSDFLGATAQWITNPVVIEPKNKYGIFQETFVIDFKEKAATGTRYNFSMIVAGKGTLSGVQCSSEATFSF